MRRLQSLALAVVTMASITFTTLPAGAEGIEPLHLAQVLEGAPKPTSDGTIYLDHVTGLAPDGGTGVLEPGTPKEELFSYEGVDFALNSVLGVSRPRPVEHAKGATLVVEADIVEDAVKALAEVSSTAPSIGTGVLVTAGAATDLGNLGKNTCEWVSARHWQYRRGVLDPDTDQSAYLDVEGGCTSGTIYFSARVDIDDYGIQFLSNTVSTSGQDSNYSHALAQANQNVSVYSPPFNYHGWGSRYLFTYNLTSRMPWGEVRRECWVVHVVDGMTSSAFLPCAQMNEVGP